MPPAASPLQLFEPSLAQLSAYADALARGWSPNNVRWMWEGEFAGQIGLRWQAGADTLPEYVLGHIGFAVVPWKRRRGFATRALGLMLEEARIVGLTRAEITTDTDNVASQRVIEANGGRLVREFANPRYGPLPKLLYMIELGSC